VKSRREVRVLQRIKQILKDQRGASFLEYIFLAVIILVAGIVTFKSIGREVGSQSREILENFKK
jgi:Flp pilus assembly pilin Flp